MYAPPTDCSPEDQLQLLDLHARCVEMFGAISSSERFTQLDRAMGILQETLAPYAPAEPTFKALRVIELMCQVWREYLAPDGGLIL